jgi:Type II secretion system (T2SS), protein M subtype b
MSANIDRRKNIVRWALAAVIVVDLALAGLYWQMARTPHAPQGELARLELQRKMMTADVSRGDEIRKDLPSVDQQCDRFFQDQFRPVGTGYSGLIADLGSIATQAGLKADATTFTQHKPDEHGVVELDIGESVEGSYPSVVAFLNGLERSRAFYILDGLSLSSSHEGSLRLSLQLRTFFRS